jgi:hypothetical protein
MPLLPRIVECQYCKSVIHSGKIGSWKLEGNQLDASRAIKNHLSVCEKAPEQIKTKLRSKKRESHVSHTNCPACGEIIRSDTVVRHLMTKHKTECIESMPNYMRDQAIKLQLPVVKVYKAGRFLLRFCLHCKKGCLATAHRTIKQALADSELSQIKRKEDHSTCCAAYETYKSLFEVEEVNDMPFYLYNCDNPDKPIRKSYLTLESESDTEEDEESEEEEEAVPKNTVICEGDGYNKLRKALFSFFGYESDYEEDDDDLVEALATAKEDMWKKFNREKAVMEKQIREKDAVIETFKTIKIKGVSGSDSSSDSDWD